MGNTIDDVQDRLYDTPAPVPPNDSADQNAGDDSDSWVAWTDIGGEG